MNDRELAAVWNPQGEVMDIVERLRLYRAIDPTSCLINGAADEIESLRRRLQDGSPIHEAVVQHMAMEIAALKRERDELVEVVSKAVKLNSFREFNDHIPAMKAALAKVGAGKTGEQHG